MSEARKKTIIHTSCRSRCYVYRLECKYCFSKFFFYILFILLICCTLYSVQPVHCNRNYTSGQLALPVLHVYYHLWLKYYILESLTPRASSKRKEFSLRKNFLTGRIHRKKSSWGKPSTPPPLFLPLPYMSPPLPPFPDGQPFFVTIYQSCVRPCQKMCPKSMICVHKAAFFWQTAEDTGALLQKIQNRSQIFLFYIWRLNF